MHSNRISRNGRHFTAVIAVCVVMALLLPVSGCGGSGGDNGNSEGSEQGNGNGSAPYLSPDMSFLVRISLAPGIAKDYTHTNLTILDADSDVQIGRVSRANSINGIRYRVILPMSYREKSVRYVVELIRENSILDQVSTLRVSPIVLSNLKAGYFKTVDTVTEYSENTIMDEMVLEVTKVSSLQYDHDFSGLPPDILPDLPIVYFLYFGDTEIGTPLSNSFQTVGGAATKGPPVTPKGSIDDLVDAEGVLGVAVKDLTWMMIMTPEAYRAGEPFTLWFFMKRTNDSFCPCNSCSCELCPYEFMAWKEATFTFAKKTITPGIEYGGTIHVGQITENDLIGCAELLSIMPGNLLP